MVNRELAKRVRTVSGAAVLKGWVESDITMATRLIMRLDQKFEIWKQQEKSEGKIVEVPKQEEKVEGKDEEPKSEEVSLLIILSLFRFFLSGSIRIFSFLESGKNSLERV